jgi:peptide subunit release factor 1 (eRF1)
MQTAEVDRATLRRLAEIAPEQGGVVSLYLNLDPHDFATPPARATAVRSLLDDAARRIRGNGDLAHEARRHLDADLERLERWFRSTDFNAGGAHGLAVFCSSAAGLFRALKLPWPVETKAYIADRPVIEPLARMTVPGRWCVLLVNRREARVLYGSRDRLDEVERISDTVHGQHDQGGWSQKRYERSVEKEVDDHLRHTAAAVLRRFRRRPFDRLLLGCPEELAGRVETELHPYLRERLAGRIEVDVENATPDDVFRAAQPKLREHDERRVGQALERLERGAGTNGRASVGLDATLTALNERRVEQLLVERGRAEPGVVCRSCGWLGAGGERRCPVDGSPLEQRENVVEAAVESAVTQAAEVVAVDPEPGLSGYGGIAAILRF